MKLFFDGEQYEISDKCITIKDALESGGYPDCNTVLAVSANGETRALGDKVQDSMEYQTIKRGGEDGYRIYRQSVMFLLIAAMNRLYPDKLLYARQSVNRSTFCRISDDNVTEEMIDAIRRQMHKMVDEKYPIKIKTYSREEAIRLLEKSGDIQSAEKLKYSESREARLFEDNGKYFSAYGVSVPNAGYLTDFDLTPYDTGFMLLYPHPNNGWKTGSFAAGKKILSTIEEYRGWHDILGAGDVFTVNRLISEGRIKEILNLSELMHEKKLSKISDEIKGDILNKRVILISGPSSSGKTTFANRLMLHLRINGLSPEIISLDDYFKGKSEAVRDKDGNYNFEDLDALDYELFNKHLCRLTDGEEVMIPRFDFQRGERAPEGRPLKLEKSSVLIVEGIHALNDRLTHSLPSNTKYKIYLSALTVMSFDRYNPISPTDTRLLRRIIRDYKYRNSSASETIDMWPSVQSGEIKNVFPFEEQADVIFNSSLIYEFNVYKNLAEPLLRESLEKLGNCPKAQRLLELLSYFKPMPSDLVPPMSIIREFIGGSSIKYSR